MKILKPYTGPLYKRGQKVTIDGISFSYSKMVKGVLTFKDSNGNSYTLIDGVLNKKR